MAAAGGRAEAEPAVPEVGATAEVVEALGTRGARFLSELMADTGRLATDLEQALWDGVAEGLLTADGFAAIQALVEGPARPPAPGRSPAGWAPGRPTTAGRWSLVKAAEPVEDREGLAEVVADQLLARWGWCSAIWPSTRARPCRGGTSSGRCAGSRTGAWCGRPLRVRLQRRAVRAGGHGRPQGRPQGPATASG